jgi:hypothetical protein
VQIFIKEECIYSGIIPDFDEDKIPYIQTLESKHLISPTDLIITRIKGERYPIKKIFLKKLTNLWKRD